MPQRIVKRPMTEKERDFLSRRLKGSPSKAGRWKQAIQNAVVMWALAMLVFVFGWKGVAWVVRRTMQADIGGKSAGAVWMMIVGALLCGAYSAFSTVRWMKKWRDMRPALRADLESGEVAEEHYEFTGAKRFQEPEHGGLMYFLRTVDGKVFVLFDHESQGLGGEGQDPPASEFQPCDRLMLVRAAHSGLVLAQSFSGARLEVGAPIELAVGPSKWPEWETYCEVKWEELEERFGKARRTRRSGGS